MLIDYRDNYKTISELKNKTNDDSTIILTDKGNSMVWGFINELGKTNKTKMFAYLRAWAKLKDQRALHEYKRNAVLVLTEKDDIIGMLRNSLFQSEIIKNYARIQEKEITNDLIGEVNEYLGTLSGVGLISIAQKELNGKPAEVFYLNKEGLRACRAIPEFARSAITGKALPVVKVKSTSTSTNRPAITIFHVLASAILAAIILVSTARADPTITDQSIGIIGFACLLPVMLWFIFYFVGIILKRIDLGLAKRFKDLKLKLKKK